MKNLFISFFILTPTFIYAQTTIETDASSSRSIIPKDLSMSFETEVTSERNSDQDNEITGYSQLFRLESSYKLNSKFRVSAGADYMVREFNESETRKTRDHLDNYFAKLNYNAASYRDNGIGDLRLQARYIETVDSFFKEFYGSDGNSQLRAYWGMPLANNFAINKYATYFRYKRYNTNSNYSDFSRDYELRARVAPIYQLPNGLDVGTTLTYNHIFTRIADEENITVDLNARKQFKDMAVLLIASYEYQNTNETGVLKYNKDAPEDITYILNFEAILF